MVVDTAIVLAVLSGTLVLGVLVYLLYQVRELQKYAGTLDARIGKCVSEDKFYRAVYTNTAVKEGKSIGVLFYRLCYLALYLKCNTQKELSTWGIPMLVVKGYADFFNFGNAYPLYQYWCGAFRKVVSQMLQQYNIEPVRNTVLWGRVHGKPDTFTPYNWVQCEAYTASVEAKVRADMVSTDVQKLLNGMNADNLSSAVLYDTANVVDGEEGTPDKGVNVGTEPSSSSGKKCTK